MLRKLGAEMSRNWVFVLSLATVASVCWLPAIDHAASGKESGKSAQIPADVSSQDRPIVRRARTRIEVRPARGPLHRECEPVFQERWIPQWGGRVLYASQRCWWARG
jgi:hypothetical protein